ncbi:MAG TPA: hypothetical protein VLF21_01770 [Candidatus Saccharimonadales bacterium]|nr:hypothetical protein [Candidatus Saccharimonadales bacterium]
MQQRRRSSVLVDLIILAIVVGGGYLAYLTHNELLDWYYLRDYQPPARIAQLADQAGMTDKGRKLFYRANPTIDNSRQQLVADCKIQNDKTIELGCYLSNDKIFLLDITDPALLGEMTVTAAHETLHAVYDRLGQGEKKRLNSLLEAEATKLSDDKLTERLSDYDKLEPGERDNELHSILGSEFAGLSPELEAYYAKYFSNRSQVVAYSRQFNQTFDGLHEQIIVLDAEIKAAKTQMNALLAAGNVPGYNAMVPGINAKINSYNSKVELYNRYASSLLGAESAAASQ